jgi:YopT peptidase
MPFGIENYVVKRIQDSAEKYGGHCTYRFSQALQPVSGMIGKSKITAGGICQALSEMWVVFHSHDQALWNWLCPNGQVSSSALANVAYNFHFGSNKDGVKLDNQDQNSDMWFLQYGIRRRTGMVQQRFNEVVDGKMQKVGYSTRSLTEGNRSAGVSKCGLGKNMAKDIVSGSMVKNIGLGDGTYRMLGVYGGDGSHCMCAYVGADVAYFDPNFGEFWFPKRDDFQKWFGEYFWPKSFYDWMLSKSYSIRDYARAVGAGPSKFNGKF